METSKRPKARPKNFGRKAAIESAIDKILKEDRQSSMDRASMLEALEFGEMGMMTPSELKRLREKLGMKKGGEVKKMSRGGVAEKEVPKKSKGFSQLPEDVQEQMNPSLAQKYEDGGAVRKKKAKSSKTGVCRGAGAAIRGTRFSGVR